MPDLLQLLQDAVAAKARYWDAERALELELSGGHPGAELPASAVETIDMLAGGIDAPGEAYTKVTQRELDEFVKENIHA